MSRQQNEPPSARLFAKYGPFRGLEVEIQSSSTRLGRAADNDVTLSDPAISQHHARIDWDAEHSRFVLVDEGSSNGTIVDGSTVRGSVPLGEVAVIGLGGVGEILFSGPSPSVQPRDSRSYSGPDQSTADLAEGRTVEEGPEFLADALAKIEASGGESPDRTAAGEAAPVLPASLGGVSASGRWVLVVHAAGESMRFPLNRGSQVLGRGATVELRIDHQHLSRQHARLDVGDTVAIEDLDSSNQTFVQGRAIDHRTELEEGDQLSFGDLKAELIYARS